MSLLRVDKQYDMHCGGSHRSNSVRWALSYGLFGAPRAGAPIAFALAALTITGNPSSGALVLAAMTAAQLLGAVPIARLGRHANTISFFRTLIAIRTAAMLVCAVACGVGAPMGVLIGAAAVAGLVQGAAFGHLRNGVNYLVNPSQMVKTLGLGAIADDITFLVTPMLAATVGIVSAPLAIVAIAAVGATPALILPKVPHLPVLRAPERGGKLIERGVSLWLACACVTAAAITAIEIGAVSIALGFDLRPEYGAVFTGTLCMASLAGSTWISIRNRIPSTRQVVVMLCLITAGTTLISTQHSMVTAIVGCALVGIGAAPLKAHCSIQINSLVASEMRAEAFSLLKTSTSVGTIVTSLAIGWTSILTTLKIEIALLAFVLSLLILSSLVVHHRTSAASKLGIQGYPTPGRMGTTVESNHEN